MEMLAHNQFREVKGIEKHLTSLKPSPYLLKLRITPASLTSCYQHSSILPEPPEVLRTITYSHTLPHSFQDNLEDESRAAMPDPSPALGSWVAETGMESSRRPCLQQPVPAELVAES